jgi:hypothetical protein
MKSFTKLESLTHPRFADFLTQMKICLIHHDDDTYEFLCEKPDKSWLNGIDFTTEQGALNACFRKLSQNKPFAQPMNAQDLQQALAINRVFGTGKASPELTKYLDKWTKKNS